MRRRRVALTRLLGALCGVTVASACARRDDPRVARGLPDLAAHADVREPDALDPSRDASVPIDAPDGGPGAASPFVVRCPMRSFPPDELTLGSAPEIGAPVVWNGREWGVAWSEVVTDEPAVFFARVGRDGRRIGNPVRVSDRGYRGSTPALLWNHTQWLVAFSGGAGRLEEIWVGSVDARGTPVGRPHRVTARNRRDLGPSMAFDGRDAILVWSTVLPDSRNGVLALRMDRAGVQLDAPILVADRRERLGAAQVVWNGATWAAAWLVSRSEAIAVDMSRIEADVSRTRGYPARVTLGPLGGTDQGARFGIAWDGARYALAWDEVRDGAPHVFFDTVSRTLEPSGRSVMLSPRGDSATAPAIAALGPSTFLAAWEVERGRERHVQVATFDDLGRPLGGRIEVQSNDGRASMPTLAVGDDAVGIATVSTRGVSFHRVPLGPCSATPPP